jgi:hypothetical protein
MMNFDRNVATQIPAALSLKTLCAEGGYGSLYADRKSSPFDTWRLELPRDGIEVPTNRSVLIGESKHEIFEAQPFLNPV